MSRAVWVLVGMLGGCSFAAHGEIGSIDVDVDTDPDAGQPVAARGTQVARDVPAQGDAGPEPGADAGAVQDAGPEPSPEPRLWETPCQDVAECPLVPGVVLECFGDHTEPGRFPHDLYGHCTFDCGEVSATGDGAELAYRVLPEREQACWALGGVCRRVEPVSPGVFDDRYCTPASTSPQWDW